MKPYVKVPLTATVRKCVVAPAKLHEHFDRASHERPAEAQSMSRRFKLKPCATKPRNIIWHGLFRPSGGQRSRSGGKLECVDVDEPGAIDNFERLFEVVVGLSGEADDDVGRDRWSVEVLVHFVDHSNVIIARVLTPHSPEDRVGTALQREMKVRDHLMVSLHRLQQIRRQVSGFEAAEPQSAQAADARAKRPDQLSERPPAGRHRLFAPNGGRLPIGTEKNPCQHKLDMPGIDKPPGLLDHLVDGFAPRRWPKLRDDAVRTVRIAAVLHFEKCPLPAGLVLSQ
jgi:hypothetical protein